MSAPLSNAETSATPPAPTNEADVLAPGLYVVATPIGNLGDITRRAEAVLREADLILAEDTRRTRALLAYLGITKKTLRCFDSHSRESSIEPLLAGLARGERIALATDAGTPSVSDPGTALVRRCHELGHLVIPIPGASAVTCAVAASGLVEQGFLFLGFLPRKGSKRAAALERLAQTREAVVVFESPARIQQTLLDLAERMPERRVCVARELTKRFEEIFVAPLGSFAKTARDWKGELTLVLESFEPHPVRTTTANDMEEVDAALLAGVSVRDIATRLAERTGLGRRDAYQQVLLRKTPRRD